MNDKYVIMFVCTGNTCRSPMAEGAMKKLLESRTTGSYEVISSGTGAAIGYPATMYAIEAAKIWDADISDHESQPVTEELIKKSDLILCMTESHLKDVSRMSDEARNKIFLFKNFPDNNPEGESVDDPIGRSLDRYNETFLEIGEYLGKYIDEVVKRIDEKTNEK